jgi:cell division protein FtsQ
VARAKGNIRARNDEPGGLWHQPALLNLLADLLIVFAVAALAWSALTALQRLPFFPLRELVLASPPERVTPAQLEHAARGVVSGNFFTVDLEAARAAFEKLPWVRKAAVQRHWPDGLTLTLEEHRALARWRPAGAAGNETALVNAQGELFAAEPPEDVDALPWLSGPEGSAPELLRRHAELAAALAPIGRHAATVTLSARLAWRAQLDDGTRIEFGRDRERHPLAERIARFVANYARTREQVGAFRVADMRYPGGFAVGAITHDDASARRETRDGKS